MNLENWRRVGEPEILSKAAAIVESTRATNTFSRPIEELEELRRICKAADGG